MFGNSFTWHNAPIIVCIDWAGLLMGVGDVISQQMVEKTGLRNHNVIRTLRQASFGLIIGVCIIYGLQRFSAYAMLYSLPHFPHFPLPFR